MPVIRSSRRIASTRLAAEARRLLGASTLCAIATVAPNGQAHVNTAYFAWDASFGIVWVSAPEAHHSRNIRENGSVAIAVYDSTQRWGRSDRGIQLFGRARQLRGRASEDAERLYRKRFRDASGADLSAYRYYGFRPTRVKLFDERRLGGGVFVTARVRGGLDWVRTETYKIG